MSTVYLFENTKTIFRVCTTADTNESDIGTMFGNTPG